MRQVKSPCRFHERNNQAIHVLTVLPCFSNGVTLGGQRRRDQAFFRDGGDVIPALGLVVDAATFRDDLVKQVARQGITQQPGAGGQPRVETAFQVGQATGELNTAVTGSRRDALAYGGRQLEGLPTVKNDLVGQGEPQQGAVIFQRIGQDCRLAIKEQLGKFGLGIKQAAEALVLPGKLAGGDLLWHAYSFDLTGEYTQAELNPDKEKGQSHKEIIKILPSYLEGFN